jgi:riboflavin kinase / FMN adenylyltransferase
VTPVFFGVDEPVPEFAKRSALAIGNFDGVHRGHHRLLAVLRNEARQLGVPAVALCLYPHPLSLLRPESAPPVLLWPERRAALLRESGADEVVFLRTTPQLLSLTAEEFFCRILIEQLQVRAVVEGQNFRFGRGRTGDVRLLADLCRNADVSMTAVALADDDEAAVSSTRIRDAVVAGNLELAADLAGRRHRIRGRVGEGAKRGRTIGFPTANLVNVLGVVPAPGVYAVVVHLDDGRSFAGACNVGGNPTFGEWNIKIETHLLDFSGDLLGLEIELEFLHRIREVKTFGSVDELVGRIRSDVEAVRAVFDAETRTTLRPELAATIAEWVRWDAEAALKPVGVELASATFTEPGVLRLQWRFDSPPPHVSFDLLFGMEERLRHAFPEVEHVVASTS